MEQCLLWIQKVIPIWVGFYSEVSKQQKDLRIFTNTLWVNYQYNFKICETLFWIQNYFNVISLVIVQFWAFNQLCPFTFQHIQYCSKGTWSAIFYNLLWKNAKFGLVIKTLRNTEQISSARNLMNNKFKNKMADLKNKVKELKVKTKLNFFR